MKAIFATAALAALFLDGCVVEPSPRYRLRETIPALTMADISRLAKEGVPDSVIVDEIKSRGIDARPSADQIVALKKEGLSDAVLQAVGAAPVHPAPVIVAEELEGYPAYFPYYSPYPYPYAPYWYGWPYWTRPYPYPYCYPYNGWHYHGYGGSVHRYRP